MTHISAHVGPDRLSAFLDNQLDPAAREEVVMHFAECVDCRREMTALRRLLSERAKPRRWRNVTPLLLAVAAALVVAIVPTVRRGGNERIASIRSGAGTLTDQPQTVSMISPVEGAVIEKRIPEFIWRSIGANVTYRVALQDSTGASVWATTTEDTTALLPDSVRLTRGEYYWSVAARLPDARSAKTGVRRLLAR